MTNSTSNKPPSKTPTTTIKLAAKEASLRNSAGGAADPGPGDPSAAPSEAPQLIDLPNPPTPSELVVKSVSSKKSATGHSGGPSGSTGHKPSGGYQSAMGASKSKSKLEGSVAGPAASNPSIGREPTSSKPLTGPTGGGSGIGNDGPSVDGAKSTGGGSHHSGSVAGSKPKSTTGSMASSHKSGTGAKPSSASSPASAKSPSQAGGSSAPNTASTAMQADSGAVHDEDEEGEGEVEQPETPGPASPAASGASGAATGPAGGLRGTSESSAGKAVSPQASTSASKKSSGASSPAPSSPAASTSSMKSSGGKKSSLMPSGMESSSGAPLGKDGKKVTKFRYHKRITVRTSGKTSPSAIMDKVNQKDHKAGITPSTIEDMDPQELMRRAGIKGTNKTHWRVRLRQTKRLTKNGKTVTQTKVAYRDSEGNKRVKTSSSPFCKTCGKKLEECKCETSSQNSSNQ